jgi:hypothetical protein
MASGFVFQYTPESFDEDVALEPPIPVHADPDIPGFEDRGEVFAGKLAALIGGESDTSASVVDFSLLALAKEVRSIFEPSCFPRRSSQKASVSAAVCH